MFQLDTTSSVVIGKDIVVVVMVLVALIAFYFFSFQLQVLLAKLAKLFGEHVGTYSVAKEYGLQRYVYQHRMSLLARLYTWVNEQLIALGMKRQGITPFGYLLFWALVSVIVGTILGFIFSLGFFTTIFSWIVCMFVFLVVTRVLVSEKMERREADVMNAIDLIVPEVRGGVKNAIIMYKDNFAPSLKDDFSVFVTNIQSRGYHFNDAIFMLADNLGSVFLDFAQKAVHYESAGDPNMLDIFVDLTETNRLRRQLRDENTETFTSLKSQFVISAAMAGGYFAFLMFTDDFSRYFFLENTVGKLLLLVIVLVIFMVLTYITTIKSRAI